MHGLVATRRYSLRTLKWSAIILPALFTLWMETVRHVFFPHEPQWLGNLLTATVALAASFAFAQVIFHHIARLQDDLHAQNRRLVTLHALASLASTCHDEPALLAAALPLVRDALGAQTVRFLALNVAVTKTDPDVPASVRAPLAHNGATLGDLVVVPETVLDRDLLRASCDTLAVALANRRLAARLSQFAILEERDRIARELHDGLAQTFAAITFGGARARTALDRGQAAAARTAIDRIEEASGLAYRDVREAIVGLRIEPETDFPAAFAALVDRFADATDLAVTLEYTLPPDTLPPIAELQLTRVAQECLTNVRKHARATQVAVVLATDTAGGTRLSIRDDGDGFDPDAVPRAGRQHFGLLIMRERVESLGGTFAVRSSPERGTTVEVTLPGDAAAMRGAA